MISFDIKLLITVMRRAHTNIAAFYASPLVKNFFIYSFGALLLRGASFMIAPITMAILSPADYGLIALVNSFISIFVIIIGCGFRQALSIEYFHYTEREKKEIINDVIGAYFICSIPLLCIGVWSIPYIAPYAFKQSVSIFLVAIIAAISCLYFFVELFYQILQYERKAFLLTTIQISTACINIAGTVICVWYLRWGAESALFAYLISMLTSFIWAMRIYLGHYFSAHFDIKRCIKKIRWYLYLGFPFIPGMLLSIALGSGNRFILAQYASLHEVGIYSLTESFGQLFQAIVLVPLSGSYLPHILVQYKNGQNIFAVEQTNQRIMYKSMFLMGLCIFCGYVVCKPLLYAIIPAQFRQALPCIPYTLFGYVFLMGQYFASAFIQFHKRTWFLSSSLIIPALCNILLAYMFVPRFKMYGCLLASVCAYAVFFIITLAFNWYLQRTLSSAHE